MDPVLCPASARWQTALRATLRAYVPYRPATPSYVTPCSIGLGSRASSWSRPGTGTSAAHRLRLPRAIYATVMSESAGAHSVHPSPSDRPPHLYHQYTMEEDGFHSISWDDAPPPPPTHRASTGFADMSAVGAADDDDDDGFDKISATSPLHEDAPEPSTSSRPPQPQVHARGAAPELDVDDLWGGRWMSVQVSDPVKEHEGSKDMYVSYAVKTQVSTLRTPCAAERPAHSRRTCRRLRSRQPTYAVVSRTLSSSATISPRAFRHA